MKKVGSFQKKVLLLLLGGLALGCTRSPKQYWKIVKAVSDDWKEIKVPRASPEVLTFVSSSLGRNGNRKFPFHSSLAEINRQALERAINALYKSKLIEEEKYNRDGTTTLVLSEYGKKRALTFNIDTMRIKPPTRWDGKWRIVIFDVPESLKIVRETLRFHLKQLKFYSLQKSVFIHPFDCRKEIEFIIEFFNVRKYVRFIVAEEVDSALAIKKHFSLL